MQKSHSASDLYHIDRQKTFQNSTNSFGSGDLITKVVSALGSIRQQDEDEQSCTGLGVNGFSDSQILSSERRYSGWSLNRFDNGFCASRANSLCDDTNQCTWNGSSSKEMRPSNLMDSKKEGTSSRSVGFNRSVSLHIPDDDNNLQTIVNREVMHRMLSKTNSPKSRLLSEQGKRHSIVFPEMISQMNLDRKKLKRGSIISLPREYISATARGRDSIFSILDAPVNNTTKSDLLEKTSIADLIRALEVVHKASALSAKEDGSTTTPKMKNHLNQMMNSRRGSLRPIPGYTTIFNSSKTTNDPIRKISSQSTPDSSLFSRHLSLLPHYPPPQYTTNASATVTPKQTGNRFSVRLSNTSPERSTNPPMPASILLQKKLPHGPSPLARKE